MSRPSFRSVFAADHSALLFHRTGYADPSARNRKADIGFVEIDKDITLRRMVVHNPRPKGTVLFLHGFPETLYAWKDISLALADDYEVHAFDWPGYGLSSRPTVDRFSYAPKDYARVLNEYIRRKRNRHIEAHDLRNGYRSPAGASPGPGKARHREDHHRRRLRPVQQTPLHVREPAKPEGGALEGGGTRRS